MKIIYILLGMIGAFYLLNIYLNSPAVHKVKHDNLLRFFKTLVNRGYDGGFMTIEGNKRGLFLQFKKYISDNDVYLEMSFPDVKWSKDYYPNLKKLLENREIEFEINQSTDSKIDFIDINCSKDLEFCVSLTKDIFVSIFDYCEEDLNYKIKFYDVSPVDEKIGFQLIETSAQYQIL